MGQQLQHHPGSLPGVIIHTTATNAGCWGVNRVHHLRRHAEGPEVPTCSLVLNDTSTSSVANLLQLSGSILQQVVSPRHGVVKGCMRMWGGFTWMQSPYIHMPPDRHGKGKGQSSRRLQWHPPVKRT